VEWRSSTKHPDGQERVAARDREQPRPEVGRLDETPAEPGKQPQADAGLDLQIAAEQAIEGRTARLWR